MNTNNDVNAMETQLRFGPIFHFTSLVCSNPTEYTSIVAAFYHIQQRGSMQLYQKHIHIIIGVSLVAQQVKNPPAMV